MEVRQVNKTQSKVAFDSAPIQRLPLEIITKIVKHLNLSDILSLASVSKIWRCVFLNQNIIWKEICSNLNICEDDYLHCVADSSRCTVNSKYYVDAVSENLFGPMCNWWLVYTHYNMVLRNIKDNNFSVVHLPRQKVEQSYCTDDYIINTRRLPFNINIEAVFIKGAEFPVEKQNLKLFSQFISLYSREDYSLNIAGNKKFLVLEIRSVIFVYAFINGQFVPKFWKTILKSANYKPENTDKIPEPEFFEDKQNTVIDLCEDKFALIHPNQNVVFLIDLTCQTICKELVYSSRSCLVDSLKCAEDRLMIGISVRDKENDLNTEYFGVVYHFEEGSDDNKFKIPLFGAVTQFKVTKNYIGIENKAAATPFITKITKLIHIFWLDCDTFSFDCTRKFIYYNVNQSIFQYDLNKSRLDKYEVTQKIAVDAISNHFSLTPINDRFLLVSSTIPNSYDIFDVKDHVSVRSILLHSGFTLAHVGKICMIFSNSKEFLIIGFR